MIQYFSSLDPMALLRMLPGSVAQGMVWAVLVLGVYITFRILDFADLTVDGSFAFGGATCVMLIRAGITPVVATLIAFAAGMIAGIVTGVLTTKLGIPGILASILTQLSLYSINLHILGSSNMPISVDNYPLLVSLRYVTGSAKTAVLFFVGTIVFLILLIGILYNFFGTELGASIRATGCNPNMARAQGINTDYIKVLTLGIANGLVGLAGGLCAQFSGAADVSMGRGAIVIGLAAVIIGEVIFGKFAAKRKAAFAWTMAAVACGSVIYYMVYQVVIWLKLPSEDLKLLTAVVVAAFLSIPYLKEKKSVKKGVA